jgi:hypothetical protein
MDLAEFKVAHEQFASDIAKRLAGKLGVKAERVTVKAPFEPPKAPSFQFFLDGEPITAEQAEVVDEIFNSLGAFHVVPES